MPPLPERTDWLDPDEDDLEQGTSQVEVEVSPLSRSVDGREVLDANGIAR